MSTPTITSERLWGIATYGDGVLLPLSLDDIEADTQAAHRALDALAVPVGAGVVLVSTFPETGFFWPFHAACIESGRLLTTVDATKFDAGRLEVLMRRFPADIVIGVNAAVLDGLAMFGFDAATVLAPVRIAVARPDAADALSAAGVRTARWLALGPAVAVGCTAGAVHLDSEEWAASAADGEIRITARRERALPVRDLPTGVRGEVVVRGECPCGRPDQSIVVAS